jgi:Ca2+-dependent lipid-binding protein
MLCTLLTYLTLPCYRYDPNVFTINLEQLLSGTPLDSAIGILKVTIESANGLKAVKLGGGAPDPYVVMGVGLKPAVNKTKVKHSTSHPVWNETQYILVNTLNESLNLSVFDYNEHRSDNALGTSVFDLASLITDAEQSGLSSKIMQDGKDRGSIKYSLSFYPVLTPKALPDGTLEPPPESSTGIVRLTIHQAKDLDLSRSSGTLSPYASVYLGGNREIHRTATMKASNSPTWESATEFLVPDKTNSTITIKLFDDRALRDPSLGTAVIRLEDLLQAKDRQQDWFPLSGVRSGKLRITTDWKPLLLPGSVGGSAAYTAPIGVMRIWLKKAVDLKNLEFSLGGKSDPYVRVLLNHQILAKTEVVDNNLNPEWDEIVYIPVHHANDHVILEIMDHQNLTKDRHLGTVEVKVSDYILVDKANNETPYLSNGGKDRTDAVLLGNGQADKGRLHHHVSFVPSVALKGGVHFEPVADPSKVLAGRPLNMPNGDSDNASLRSAIGDGGSVREPEEEQSGVTLGINELLRERKSLSRFSLATHAHADLDVFGTESGVLVLQVIAGMMPKKGRFEVLVDENATPSFQTEKARGHKNTWDQIGELVIRELDFSQLTLRMNENDPDEKPDIYAELRVLTRNLLEAAWVGKLSPASITSNNELITALLLVQDAPSTYTLNVVGGATSEKTTVLLQARYVPLRMALEMRESVISKFSRM